MRFYTAVEPMAPNPRRVEIFLAEKGIEVPTTALALAKREHKAPDFVAKHPRGQVPALELDDGTVLTESVAICRYLDELRPEPPMFGRTALERAQVDMWTRRVELILVSPIAQFWQHAHPFTAKLLTQFRDFGESNRERVADAMRWFDGQMAGRKWLATDDYTIADIVLLTAIEFAGFCGLPVPDECTTLKDWNARATARPSAKR
jgi:glutathione S-transferase